MNTKNLENSYDVIFIGSGIGSLTAASLLAQHNNSKVLILEKHFQAGGFTHEFQRKQNKYSWDVGIHYIGDLGEKSFLRKVFDSITRKGVKWERMKEPFEKFVYPDKTFSVYGEPERYISDLIKEFPEEEQAIRKYFKDVQRTATLIGKHTMLRLSPPPLETLIGLFDTEKPILTLKDYYDIHFKDERLKGILTSQWGNYGLPPHLASFAIHAQVVQHYLNGGYFPLGGSGKIFESIEPIIEEKGGKTLTSHSVEEILIEDNKAVGVKVKTLRGEEKDTYQNFYAPVIVSNTGAYSTYMWLIPETQNISFRADLKNFFESLTSISSITIYLGLKDNPQKLGFQGENHWIYATYDHDKAFVNRKNWLEDGDIPIAYLSFPSLKNPEAKAHTADIISFLDYEFFEKWKDKPWKKRGEDYKELKDKIADKLINYVDSKYPGFKDMIDYIEVSTPITNEHFTSHPKGSIYGLPCVSERYDKEKCPWFDIKTPIKNLYLTGADTSSPGISGALMGGLNVANVLMEGKNIIKFISKS
ncbi:MAG: NAD(P)/FAD-dependent oxidoreductase [Leptospiraceae bacterium]|nr:NAD(P)/FAD-dependent oxidoreductase [Leptospiraceae bacterium]MCP5497560.1 NAD(P)/FAD-dependent oxidoreductase [Leptospiraceae bacterium]